MNHRLFTQGLLVLLLLVVAAPVPGGAAPAMAALEPSLRTVGKGSMHWLWWKLYDARLLSADGRYRRGQRPLLLQLRYARDISRDQLLETTRGEWQRLGVDGWQQQVWSAALARLWPDVTTGQQLSLYLDGKGSSHFYHQGRYLGAIDTPAFGEAFLDIWLSPRTRAPQLRRQLTGER